MRSFNILAVSKFFTPRAGDPESRALYSEMMLDRLHRKGVFLAESALISLSCQQILTGADRLSLRRLQLSLLCQKNQNQPVLLDRFRQAELASDELNGIGHRIENWWVPGSLGVNKLAFGTLVEDYVSLDLLYVFLSTDCQVLCANFTEREFAPGAAENLGGRRHLILVFYVFAWFQEALAQRANTLFGRVEVEVGITFDSEAAFLLNNFFHHWCARMGS